MICDRVGIVMKGRLVASGRVDELVRQDHTQSVEIVCQQVKVEGNAFIHSLADPCAATGPAMPDRIAES